MNKFKNKKGITLVALIITIIVLIILAGITISIALGENGIFKKSKKAVDEYQKSAKAEEEELDTVYDNLESLDPNSLAAHVKVGDYVEYNPKDGVGENSNELTYTSRRGSYEAKDESGNYIIGEGESFANQDDTYNKDGYHYYAKGFLYNDAGSIIDENGNLTKGSGESGSGSIATTGDPKSTDQTFTVKDNNLKWRVLSIENGCVNLVCSSTIKEDTDDEYDLYGITGYNYGVEELNNICSIYGYGKGAKSARSINVDDVNKLTKYNNPKEKYTNYGKLRGWGEEGNKHKWKDTYYWYTTNSSADSNQYYHKVDDQKVLNVLFKDENNTSISYWLASCYVSTPDNEAIFGLRIVDKDNVGGEGGLFHCNSDGDENYNSDSFSVRPIVTLRSEVKYDNENNSDNDGSKDKPYKFTFDENSYGE